MPEAADQTASGTSSRRLLLRGFSLEAAGAFMVIPIVVGSRLLPGDASGLWFVTWATVGVALVALGVAYTIQAYRQDARQLRAGFTTLWKSAVDHPEVEFRDGTDGTVISGPHERRPASGRKRDIQAAKAANSGRP